MPIPFAPDPSFAVLTLLKILCHFDAGGGGTAIVDDYDHAKQNPLPCEKERAV